MGQLTNTNEPEWDARILADAAKINADPSRLAAARDAAHKLLKDNEIETLALKGIAGHIYDHDTSVEARKARSTD